MIIVSWQTNAAGRNYGDISRPPDRPSDAWRLHPPYGRVPENRAALLRVVPLVAGLRTGPGRRVPIHRMGVARRLGSARGAGTYAAIEYVIEFALLRAYP